MPDKKTRKNPAKAAPSTYTKLVDSVDTTNKRSRVSTKTVSQMSAKDAENFKRHSAMSQAGAENRYRRHAIFLENIDRLKNQGYSDNDLCRLLALIPETATPMVRATTIGKAKEKFRYDANGKPMRSASKSEIMLAFIMNLLHEKGVDLNEIRIASDGTPSISRSKL